MKRWGTIRTRIETRLAPNTSFFVRDHCFGSRGALSSACRTDINARGLFAVLTDDGHEDGDLFPLLHPYPRKGRTAGAFMRKAADHFAGLASCAALRNDGDSAHVDNLLILFFTVNTSICRYDNIYSNSVKHSVEFVKNYSDN
jgi:hypothetical protein